MWNPHSRKLSLVKSGILGFGIRNSGQGFQNAANDRNPESKFNDKKSRVDSSFHLIYRDPSDFGSRILIRIISKERTPRLSWITDSQLRCLGSAMTLKEVQRLFPRGGRLQHESGGDARCLA